MSSVGELGCTYAALLLFDDGIPITYKNPAVAVAAAPVAGGGAAAAAPASEEKKEEVKEDNDEDLGLSLFD
ncbi:hypothetical protein K7X08_023177 [Anisodus acutangulus]|uniref:60S acidic ribosomal protein P1 n=1 Tax=Anisodus acutangulus TaxID=402998 RepID=A0A9Q1R2F0_9SOLA|nr:hypothetical protein K7X08_023177 [Anisodus acutangulus]